MTALLKWMSIIFGLVFVYLVVRNPQAFSQVVGSLSNANTNAILALQGNRPNTV